jgi:hypothetical protein
MLLLPSQTKGWSLDFQHVQMFDSKVTLVYTGELNTFTVSADFHNLHEKSNTI